jgi:hypothetical protein
MIEQRKDEARKLQHDAEVDQRRIDQLKKDGQPIRRVREWETDVFISTTNKVGQGLLIGWGLNEHWRFQLIGTFVSPDPSYGNGSTYFSDGYAGLGRVKWVPYDTRLAPYAALGMSFQRYEAYSYGYVAPVDVNEGDVVEGRDSSYSSSQREGYAHLVVPAIGVDLQLRFGLHLGIELQYPIPIYTLVRDVTTRVASDSAAAQLKDALKKGVAVGFVFGWAWDLL